MLNTSRPLRCFRWAGVVGVSALLVPLAGCSGGDDVASSTSAPVVTPTTVAVADETTDINESTTTTEAVPSTTLPIPDDAVMQLAFQFAAEARWPDGTKIGVDDVRCTVEALRSTPGSVGVDAYNSVIDVRAGRAEDLVEVYFNQFVANYRVLFDRLLQASAVESCSDVSDAFDDEAPAGWGSFRVEAWNAAQMILVPTASEEDVVDGEVSENYRDNVIKVCNGEKETEYANDDGEEYWMACLDDIEGAAAYIAPIASAVVTAAYLSF